jgi:glycosyltransferase involved in cell wall biosynthesis
MGKPSLTVIIPSRSQPQQAAFLRRAVHSVRSQRVIDQYALTVVVGIDAGTALPPGLADELGLVQALSEGRSQAAALNAGIALVDSDFVAFLEDDDQWLPTYLETVTQALSSGAFVSSTQLEVDEHEQIVRINDFPTPSGWFMPQATLRAVGLFDESYRFHLDNDWLGRLAQARVPRVHLIEATAPCDGKYVPLIRPWLDNVVQLSGGLARLGRHGSPYPLVRRMVHAGSGMGQIEQDPALRQVSLAEMDRLRQRFGRVPW